MVTSGVATSVPTAHDRQPLGDLEMKLRLVGDAQIRLAGRD